MRRGWLPTALLVIVFGAVAAAVGLSRHPTYEAQTLVVVGKVDVQTPGLSGFVATTQSLASAYSRAIQTNAVLKPAGKTLGITPRQLGSEVSASPIPESPVFRVKADASTKEHAIAAANATSRALVTYIADINRTTPNQGSVVRTLKDALIQLNQQTAQRGRLQRIAKQNPSRANNDAVALAQAEVQTTKLRTRTLSTAYQASQSEPSTNLVQVLAPARNASSDRTQTLELFVLIGILAGLAVGIALSRLSTNRASDRASQLALGLQPR